MLFVLIKTRRQIGLHATYPVEGHAVAATLDGAVYTEDKPVRGRDSLTDKEVKAVVTRIDTSLIT